MVLPYNRVCAPLHKICGGCVDFGGDWCLIHTFVGRITYHSNYVARLHTHTEKTSLSRSDLFRPAAFMRQTKGYNLLLLLERSHRFMPPKLQVWAASCVQEIVYKPSCRIRRVDIGPVEMAYCIAWRGSREANAAIYGLLNKEHSLVTMTPKVIKGLFRTSAEFSSKCDGSQTRHQ